MKNIRLLALSLLCSTSAFSAGDANPDVTVTNSDSNILPSILKSSSIKTLDYMTDQDKQQTQGQGLESLNALIRSQHIRNRLHRKAAD